MDKLNNTILEEMYKKHYKEFEDTIYKNNKELQEKSETTIESLAVIYDMLNRTISDPNAINLISQMIKKMIRNYTNEFQYVASLAYKYGIINGVENYNIIQSKL